MGTTATVETELKILQLLTRTLNSTITMTEPAEIAEVNPLADVVMTSTRNGWPFPTTPNTLPNPTGLRILFALKPLASLRLYRFVIVTVATILEVTIIATINLRKKDLAKLLRPGITQPDIHTVVFVNNNDAQDTLNAENKGCRLGLPAKIARLVPA